MKCTIYRAHAKDYTYLYLRADFPFDDLPEPLLQAFLPADEVMELEIGPERSLANADVTRVRAQLASEGYYVQLPPNEDPSGWLELESSQR